MRRLVRSRPASLVSMSNRRHITLFATILALAASIASGGGVARFVHLMVAHGGSACTSPQAHAGHLVHTSGLGCPLERGRCDAPAPIPNAPSGGDHESSPAHSADGCAVCAELAVNMPTPELASPFDLTVELLAIVHEREAALQPTVVAPRVFAARPPPVLL